MMAAGVSHTHHGAHHHAIEDAIERLARFARPFDDDQNGQVGLSHIVSIVGAVVIIALLAFVALIR